MYCPFLDCVASWTHNVVWSCGLVTETRYVCVCVYVRCVYVRECVRSCTTFSVPHATMPLVGMEEEMC